MARGRRKVNTGTLDAKIEQQKAALEKAKAKYEAEKETLAALTDRWAAERMNNGNCRNSACSKQNSLGTSVS